MQLSTLLPLLAAGAHAAIIPIAQDIYLPFAIFDVWTGRDCTRPLADTVRVVPPEAASGQCLPLESAYGAVRLDYIDDDCAMDVFSADGCSGVSLGARDAFCTVPIGASNGTMWKSYKITCVEER